MNAYKAALMRREFPFIDQLFVVRKSLWSTEEKKVTTSLWPEEVNDIKVRKGDKALLAKKGSEDSYSWSGGGHHHYTKYFAVTISTQNDDDGKVVELASAGYSGNESGENRWDAPSIDEQLFGQNLAPDYIVECVQNDTDDNGNGELSRFWTIYKMKRFDLATHHKDKINEAAAALKSEIDAAHA